MRNILTEINEEVRLINGTLDYYISENGNVYRLLKEGKWLKKKLQTLPSGYVYCGIKFENKIITKRVHVIVAKEFISNIDNLPTVNHIDGNKQNNKVSNLQWCTVSENTQHAYDNGLAKNNSGYNDSQSFPVVMFDTKTNLQLKRFGSISIASTQTDIDKTTIARQCKYKKPVRKEVYFRYEKDVDIVECNDHSERK